MSRGKTTCKVLKEVRRKIADANGIPLPERECTHTGDCAGTCPYCESEVRYLECELSKRKSLGKAVAVAGIAVAAVSMEGQATAQPVSSSADSQIRQCDTIPPRWYQQIRRHAEAGAVSVKKISAHFRHSAYFPQLFQTA